MAVNLSELTKRLQCAICLEKVCKPKSLSCNHSYCQRCLDKLLQFSNNGSATIKCPQGCENNTKISRNQTTNDLGTDYMLKGVLELTNVEDTAGMGHAWKLTCETCPRDVKRYCCTCKVFKCERCLDVHDGIEDFFVPVDCDEGQKEIVIMCKEHSVEATHICCEKKFICLYCIHRGHKGHQHESLAVMEKSLKDVLTEKISCHQDLDKRQREVKKDILCVKHNLEQALKVNKLKCISAYSEYLDKEEQKIKDEFHALCTDYTSALDSITYFQDCLFRDGVHFALQRSEILKKLNADLNKTIPDMTVSLAEVNFNGQHPLGSLDVIREEHQYGNDFSGGSFRSKINTENISPSSISSLHSLKDTLEQFFEEFSAMCIEKHVEMEDIIKEYRLAEVVIRFQINMVSEVKDTVLSDPVIIRNMPWRIMLMPRYSANQSGERIKVAGIFIQCDPEGKVSSWSCKARAKITLKNHKGDDFTRRITHLFFAEEKDWGYSSFVPWDDIIDSSKGYNKNDSITIEGFIQAEPPEGVFWYYKTLTGNMGLKKHGDTTSCMNSLLQTLFFTNKLRKAVYHMPTENDDINKSVMSALQRIFYDLQCGDKSVATENLTKSLGWRIMKRFIEHDARWLCRLLLDNGKIKSTIMGGIIPELLEGKMNSYIQCTNVDYYSSREEPFYGIQLNVKGKTGVLDSFDEYIKGETLDGDNKYDAGEYGLQDAKEGFIFRHFPPVLHLHLLRFQYDPVTDTNYKINDRYTFPETLDLSNYLEEVYKSVEPEPIYTLQSVLVHSGDNHGGHYVVYINSKGDGKWYKFDNDVVSQASKKEAIENNFGGSDDVAIPHCTNAYMLSYIRSAYLKDILCEVTSDDIPAHLEAKFLEERRLEAQRRKERNEAHLYMDVQVLTEDSFCMWSGNDLFDLEHVKPVNVRIQKKEKLKDATKIIAESFGYTASQCRLWPFQRRGNNTSRPAGVEIRTEDKRRFENPDDIELFYANDQDPVMLAFLETLNVDSGVDCLPDFDSKNEIILFFKYYNPASKIMSYCGHAYIDLKSQPTSLFPMLCQRAGLAKGTKLLFYEEIKCGQTEKTKTDRKFDEVVQDLMDGDIICFQADTNLSEYEIPTPIEYFRDIMQQVQVIFCDKNNPSNQGFVETLNLKMTYDEIAQIVSTSLDVDKMKIRFFKPQIYRDYPGNLIKCTFDGQLKELITGGRRGPRKLYYQILAMPVNIPENKIQFKCNFVNAELKDETELVIPVDKQAFVQDLINEVQKQVQTIDSKKLRLVEILSCKIQRIVPVTTSLDGLVQQPQKEYRIEEIPTEELDDDANSMLVPVMHFRKKSCTAFGTPFYIKITEGETRQSLQERVRKRLYLPDKEFNKIKFSVVCLGKVTYFPDDPSSMSMHLTLSDFKNNTAQTCSLGLDHVKKALKRTRQSVE